MPTMEVVARRADVMKGALHNRANFHAHERQHTSTFAPVVRGFKIDGNECGGGAAGVCGEAMRVCVLMRRRIRVRYKN